MDIMISIDAITNVLANIYTRLDTKHSVSGIYDFVSLEYFSVAIFNSLLELNLININEEKSNAEGIDLFDKEKKIGIQVTIERPTSKKIEKSKRAFSVYRIDKIIVFFFQNKEIRKLKSSQEVEIWSLPTIIGYLRKNPDRCVPLYHTLKIWDDSHLNPSDLVDSLNGLVKRQIGEMIRLKKYDSALFVNDAQDYKICRLFCGSEYSKMAFKEKKNLLQESSYFSFLCSIDTEDVFSSIEDFENGKFYQLSVDQLDKHKAELLSSFSQSKEGRDGQFHLSLSNRFTSSIFEDILSLRKTLKFELLSIVRSAGQGKTMFCCNLAYDLANDGVACVFLSPCLSGDYPYRAFKMVVENLLEGGTYIEKLKALSSLLYIRGRNIIIVIDAVNEYKDILKAINELGNIMDDIRKCGLIPKIIISSRNKIYNDFKNRFDAKTLLNNSICLSPSHYNNGAIVNRYFEEYSISGKPKYRVYDLFNQSRLFIKIFCSLYKKMNVEELDYSSSSSLIDEYMKNRAFVDMNDQLFTDTETFYQTCDSVARCMLARKSFSDVPIIAFDEKTRNNIRKIGDGDIFQETKTDEGFNVRFVFEEFRDYFVYKVLLDNSAAEIEDVISNSQESLDGLGRMLFLYRRHKGYNVLEDYKYSWYLIAAIYSLPSMACEKYDFCDEDVFLQTLKSIQVNSEYNDYMIVFNILKPFLKYKQETTYPFQVSKLLDIDEISKKKASKAINNLSNVVINYICGEICDNSFHLIYMKDIISFCKAYSIRIDNQNLRRIMPCLGLSLFDSNNWVDQLKSLGFSDDEIRFLVEEG